MEQDKCYGVDIEAWGRFNHLVETVPHDVEGIIDGFVASLDRLLALDDGILQTVASGNSSGQHLNELLASYHNAFQTALTGIRDDLDERVHQGDPDMMALTRAIVLSGISQQLVALAAYVSATGGDPSGHLDRAEAVTCSLADLLKRYGEDAGAKRILDSINQADSAVRSSEK